MQKSIVCVLLIILMSVLSCMNVEEASQTDVTAPTWGYGYPQTGVITATAIDISVLLDESGKVYYSVFSNGATAPEPGNVKAGGISGAVTDGYADFFSNTNAVFTISGLLENVEYDVYLVAEDAAAPNPNLQTSVKKLDVKTANTGAVNTWDNGMWDQCVWGP